ncbi:MAG: hypothetical protein N2558_04760, partial [Patescibacteria group bacterium]|nr:hypothetical protein [Patescibacteria group bacterium]
VTIDDWLTGLQANGVANFCAGASFHSYANWSSSPSYHNRQKRNLDSIWCWMKNKGFSNKFLWCSEYATGFFDTSFHDSMTCFRIQADEQIASLISFCANDKPKGPLQNTFGWAFSHLYFPDIEWEGQRFCLIRDDFSYRPVGLAFRQLANLLQGYRLNRCLVNNSLYDSIRVYEFENALIGRRLFVGWKERNIGGGSLPFTVPLRTNAAEIIGVKYNATIGRELKPCTKNGMLSVLFDTSPVFICEPTESVVQEYDLAVDSAWISPTIPNTKDPIRLYFFLKENKIIKPFVDTVFISLSNNDSLILEDKFTVRFEPNLTIALSPKRYFSLKKGKNLMKFSVWYKKQLNETDYTNNKKYFFYEISR